MKWAGGKSLGGSVPYCVSLKLNHDLTSDDRLFRAFVRAAGKSRSPVQSYGAVLLVHCGTSMQNHAVNASALEAAQAV